MNEKNSLPIPRRSSTEIGHTSFTAPIAGTTEQSTIDRRDPAELGEELLAFKKKRRFKTLSRAAKAYEERKRDGSI